MKATLLLALAGAAGGSGKPGGIDSEIDAPSFCGSRSSAGVLATAYALASRKRYGEAVSCFGATLDRFAHVDTVWTDYGRALVQHSKQLARASPTTAGPKVASLQAQAIASFDLGSWLGDARGAMYKGRVKFGDPLGGDAVATAMPLFLKGGEHNHHAAAVILCSSADAITVDLEGDAEPAPRHQHPRPVPVIDAPLMRRAVAIMKICGVVKLGKAASGAQAELAPEVLNAHGRELGESLEKVERWEGRFEIKLPLRLPFADGRLTMNPRLLAVVRAMLGTFVEIDTFSHVTSYPGAPDQPWHTDVGASLFPGVQLPPHGLVAIVPLINVTADHGPTEFIAGSHMVQLGHQHDVWRAHQDAPPTPVVCPPSEVFLPWTWVLRPPFAQFPAPCHPMLAVCAVPF